MFREALQVVENAVNRYEEMKSKERSEFKGGANTALALVGELLVEFRDVVSTAVSIEEALESSKLRVGRVCEGLTYVSDESVVAFIHRSPFAAVSYRKKDGTVALSGKYLSMALDAGGLEIRYRDRATVFRLTMKDDIINNSSVLRALASEELTLIKYISSIVESCRRRLGLR